MNFVELLQRRNRVVSLDLNKVWQLRVYQCAQERVSTVELKDQDLAVGAQDVTQRMSDTYHAAVVVQVTL